MLESILFVYGVAIGSFLNVLIDRLSMEEGIGGRSHCDHCKKTLKPKDLIPVFSFLSTGGKCRYCKKKLSLQYPIVELLTGVTYVISWHFSPFDNVPLRILTLALSSVLLVILVADLKYQIIPDEMQVALIVIGIALVILQKAAPSAVLIRVAEGALVMSPILLLYVLTKGRGMGFGDVKLAFGIGLLLGAVNGALALYIAFLSGAIVGVGLLVASRKKMNSKIAFGPFLIVGIVCMFFLKNEVFFVVDKLFKTN